MIPKKSKRKKTEAQKNTAKIKRIKLIVFSSIMIVFTLVSVIWYVPIEKLINGNYFTGSEDLKIHFIDVGHGDAIIVDLPDGKNVLIDSGPECDNLDNYINHIFKDDIVFDYFILTHIDGDHIGNALDVLKKYKVNTLYRPSILSSGETGEGLAVSKNEKYNKLIDFATANNINMCYNRSGEVILGDNYRFDFLSPEKIYYEKDNLDNCICCYNLYNFCHRIFFFLSTKI